MPDSRQVQTNAVPNQSTDNIEDSISRLKVNENQDTNGVAHSAPYPDRPGEPDCLYFLRTGACGYGTNCRFNHPAYTGQVVTKGFGNEVPSFPTGSSPLGSLYYRDELPERVGQPDCEYFLKTGTCKYGSTCKYHHPKDRNGAGPVSFNFIGLPMRKDEKSCAYYMKTGACKFGVACKFHHPQPANAVHGSAPYTPSPVLPASGLPYVGGIPSWPLPKPTYLTTPSLQSPHGYVPVVLSPSQNIMAAQSWNTYTGNVSSTNMIGTNFLYETKGQADLGFNTHFQMIASSALPDKPDQPECRYYMNHGICKYGSDCKYHHPKERVAQLTTGPVSTIGLPSRPGQPMCPNYQMYGLCKFGPTCRYDHPYLGYPFNYGFSYPMPMYDSSMITYQRISPTAHSTASSHSMSSKLPDDTTNPDKANIKQEDTTEAKKSSDGNSKQTDFHPNTVEPSSALDHSS